MSFARHASAKTSRRSASHRSSHGSHTIARGAAEDAQTGERVSVQAEGATPLALILSLLKSALELPTLARTFAKGFLPSRK